jgi:hypothetical protein
MSENKFTWLWDFIPNIFYNILHFLQEKYNTEEETGEKRREENRRQEKRRENKRRENKR